MAAGLLLNKDISDFTLCTEGFKPISDVQGASELWFIRLIFYYYLNYWM